MTQTNEIQTSKETKRFCGTCGTPIPPNMQECLTCMQKRQQQAAGTNMNIRNTGKPIDPEKRLAYAELFAQEKNAKIKMILSIIGIAVMSISFLLSVIYYEDIIMLIETEGILVEFGIIFFTWKLIESVNQLKLIRAKMSL